MKLLIYISCFFFTCLTCYGEQIQGLSWSPRDLMNLKSVKDVQISPSGQSVLFVVTEASSAENHLPFYKSRIFKKSLSTSDYHVLGPENCSNLRPRWSHDGKWIAFLSDGPGVHSLYIMDADGNNIREVACMNRNIQTFKWSPDDKKIAFVMPDEKHTRNSPSEYGLTIYGQRNTINRLWLIHLAQEHANPLICTSDNFCVKGTGEYGTANEEFDWSPNGEWIIFAYSPSISPDDFYLDSSLAMINSRTFEIITLKNSSQHESMPRFSSDGKWIAYLAGSPPGYAFNKTIMVRSTDGKIKRQLSPTFNEGPYFAGPSLLGWIQNDSQLLFFEPKGTKYHLLSVPIDTESSKEIQINGFLINEPTLSYDGSYLGFVSQACDTPPEAFITRLSTISPIKVSQVNHQLRHEPKIYTELIKWNGKDGLQIEGLLTYPPNYRKGQAYPLVLMIHGGPMGFFEQTFIGTPSFYSVASLANEGYLILRPNPRGSNGYGKKFRCLNYGDWGGKDAEDLLAGVDELIKAGMALSDKLGVMGWSYGGYLTARLISLTDRFKAAIIGAGISNLVSFSGTSDLTRLTSDYLGEFWQNVEIYQNRSPLNYTGKITTPCLILHGQMDERVPCTQARELYYALKKKNKPVKMILFPGMGHGCRDPRALMDIMQENINWFKSHFYGTQNNIDKIKNIHCQ